MKQAVLDELRHHFRPEFLNRVDEIIVFHALSEADLKKILVIQLGRLRPRLEERHIDLELTEAAATHLAPRAMTPFTGPARSSGRFKKNWKLRLAAGCWRRDP